MNDEIYLVPTYLVNDKVKEYTRNTIQALKANGKEILLYSHYYIPEEFQQMVDYCIYDKRNTMLSENQYKGWLHRKHFSDKFEVKSKEFLTSNSSVACFYFNHALSYIKNLEKRIVHLVDYDNVWNNLDVFENNYKILTTTNYESIRFKYDDSNQLFANIWSVDLSKHNLDRYIQTEEYLKHTVSQIRRYEEWYPVHFMDGENVLWKYKSEADRGNELALSSVNEPEWVCLAVEELNEDNYIYFCNPSPNELNYELERNEYRSDITLSPFTYYILPLNEDDKILRVFKNGNEIRNYDLENIDINEQRETSTLIRYE